MSFTRVATVSQLPPGGMQAYSPGGRDILLVNYNGGYYALNRRCTHRGGDLAKGTLKGKVVTCPRHGSRFDVTTGKCLSGPRLGPLSFKVHDEDTYPVRVEGDEILVDVDG